MISRTVRGAAADALPFNKVARQELSKIEGLSAETRSLALLKLEVRRVVDGISACDVQGEIPDVLAEIGAKHNTIALALA